MKNNSTKTELIRFCAALLALACAATVLLSSCMIKTRDYNSAKFRYDVDELTNTVTITGFDKGSYQMNAIKVPCFIDGKKVTKIESIASTGNGDNKSTIILPETLEVIGEKAFYLDIDSVYIPYSVHVIEEEAFAHCPQLKKVYLPKNVEIKSGAFPDGVVFTYR